MPGPMICTDRTYPVVIETDSALGYGAFFPDLPGCVSAGDTQESCITGAKEALALHLAGMIEDGDPLPDATPIRNVTVDPDVEVATILMVSVE